MSYQRLQLGWVRRARAIGGAGGSRQRREERHRGDSLWRRHSPGLQRLGASGAHGGGRACGSGWWGGPCRGEQKSVNKGTCGMGQGAVRTPHGCAGEPSLDPESGIEESEGEREQEERVGKQERRYRGRWKHRGTARGRGKKGLTGTRSDKLASSLQQAGGHSGDRLPCEAPLAAIAYIHRV